MRTSLFRSFQSIALVTACTCLWSCSEPRLECGADAVTGTLSSMVRDRVLRVAADSYPSTIDAAKRAALTKATRVTPVEMKLVEWDTERGRLACVATVVVDAPGPYMDTNLRREAKLPYRVMRDSGEVFLVEIAYADLLMIVPAPTPAASGTSPKP
jgi:hypothetical protein